MVRTNTQSTGEFKMKITTMKRPDDRNQYKITLPKNVVDFIRKDNLVGRGIITIEKNHVFIKMSHYEKRE